MIMSKQEVMKRYLRGDFDTLHKIANNDYGGTANIFWGMRNKGWCTRGHLVEKDMTGNGAWAVEGGPEWRKDLMDVLETLGYAFSHIN